MRHSNLTSFFNTHPTNEIKHNERIMVKTLHSTSFFACSNVRTQILKVRKAVVAKRWQKKHRKLFIYQRLSLASSLSGRNKVMRLHLKSRAWMHKPFLLWNLLSVKVSNCNGSCWGWGILTTGLRDGSGRQCVGSRNKVEPRRDLGELYCLLNGLIVVREELGKSVISDGKQGKNKRLGIR